MAFLRRFQLVIDFEIPDYAQRLKLWETALMGEFKYDQKVNLKELSEKHELSAAAIINVLHFCLLKSLQRGEKIISMEDLIQAIRFNTFLH
jgi:ATP-dependent 26S proteasome regulatory subunit